MQPRLRVLAVSLAAALTLVSVGCGTEGKGDDTSADDKKAGTTTVASSDSTTVDDKDPAETSTTVEKSDGNGPSVGGEGGPYVEALKRSMLASNEDGGEFQLTDGQADCVAPRFISIIGVDRLEKNGVTPADFENEESMDFSDLKISEAEGNALYDTYAECDINLSELMITSMAAEGDMTPELQACMEAVFTDDNLRLLMVTSMVKGDAALEEDPAMAPVMAQMMGCAFMGMGEGMDDDGTTFEE